MQQIELVQQQCDYSCGIACVSMVTGVPFGEILKQAGMPDIVPRAMDELLMRNGRSIRRYLYPTMQPEAVYIATVASLNWSGGMHYVVVDSRESAFADRIGTYFTVFDPNEGRDGRRSYSRELLKSWGSLVEIIDYQSEG